MTAEPLPRFSDRRTASRRPRSSRLDLGSVALLGLLIVAALQLTRAPHSRREFLSPLRRLAPGDQSPPSAVASRNAFGRSGGVHMRRAMPGGLVTFPLAVEGDPGGLTYAWERHGDSVTWEPPRPLVGPHIVAPVRPGIYRLVLLRDGRRRVVATPTLAVLAPFASKYRGVLNGYRIGYYVAEHLGGLEHPKGFLEVRPADLDLPVSRHLVLADFVAHDAQQEVWPKYVALEPRILDKLELVLSEVVAARPPSGRGASLALEVRSGFRTPGHNRGVRGAARDSRHQYGDAADVAVDANGDGRVDVEDARLLAAAVDRVEARNPDLAGGLGLYVGRRYRTPYVHVDARGRRSRWRL